MGIPYYFSYIIKNYPSILVNTKNFNTSVDALYIDSNSIIYDVFNELEESPKQTLLDFETTLINKVIEKIQTLIDAIKPQQRVYIAFDGVAPMAKLQQQRTRRYKSDYQKNMNEHLCKNANIKSKSKTWSTCNITPGTKFMDHLNAKIKTFSGKSALPIIFSGSDEPGEGEHKLFSFIRDNNFHIKESIIIYGLDADLIMLCLNHLHLCREINLWRETPHFIKSLQAELDEKENYVLNMSYLSEKVMSFLDEKVDNVLINLKRCMEDYIFICFLLGNDFLPHFPSINIRTGGIDKLLLAYKKLFSTTQNYLTLNGNINWDIFAIFIELLRKQEESFLIEEYKMRNKKEKNKIHGNSYESHSRRFELTPCFERDIEHFINPTEAYWQKRYYSSLLFIKNDDSYQKRQKVCLNYLQGLEWTLKYYTTSCCDWNWEYNYNYPPLLEDLIKFIPTTTNHSFFINTISTPLNPLVQLAYVLPHNQLSLLPPGIKNKIYHELGDCYKNDWEFQWAFCKYFWEGHVIMAKIDIEKLKTIIQT